MSVGTIVIRLLMANIVVKAVIVGLVVQVIDRSGATCE